MLLFSIENRRIWYEKSTGNVQRMIADDVNHHHRFATTSKIKNRCPGFWWNVFEIFFGGREERVMI
jgi:hypothetical protein